MTSSKRVFIAPDMFFAFIDRAHAKHIHAAAFFRYFAQENYILFTNIVSINNAYHDIYHQISPSLAKDFLRALSLGTINILYPDDTDTKMALKALINYTSTELTFEESLMAVLAYKRNVHSICTFGYLHPLFGQNVFYLPI